MRDLVGLIGRVPKPYKREEKKDMSFDHVNYQKNRIFKLLETIETMTQVMAHEDEYCQRQLKSWQDGHLANSTFISHLTGYIDHLNSGSK